MKYIKLLSVVMVVLFAVSCGKGIEVGTPAPMPLENVMLQIGTANGEFYQLSTGEGGEGLLQRLNSEGAVIEEIPVTVTLDESNSFEVTVTFGDGTVVTISGSIDESGNMVNITLTINGQVIEIVVNIISDGSSDGSGSSGGSSASAEGVGLIFDSFYSREVAYINSWTSGISMGRDDAIQSEVNRIFYSSYPKLVWNGEGYGAAWFDDDSASIYFARLDAVGNTISGPTIVTDSNSRCRDKEFKLVWTGTEYGLAWIDNRAGSDDIYFVHLDSNGDKIGSDVRITNVENSIGEDTTVGSVSLVSSGNGYGLAYNVVMSDWSRTSSVFFVRLDSSGNRVGEALELSDGLEFPEALRDREEQPRLVWNGSEYGITWFHTILNNDDDWQVSYGVNFARISSDGNLTGEVSATKAIEAVEEIGHLYPSKMIWTGDQYTLMWHYHLIGEYGEIGITDYYVLRMNSEGEAVDSPVKFMSGGYGRGSIVWNGSEYGVLVSEITGDLSGEVIMNRHLYILDESGTAIDEISISYGEISIGASIVWTGSTYGGLIEYGALGNIPSVYYIRFEGGSS